MNTLSHPPTHPPTTTCFSTFNTSDYKRDSTTGELLRWNSMLDRSLIMIPDSKNVSVVLRFYLQQPLWQSIKSPVKATVTAFDYTGYN